MPDTAKKNLVSKIEIREVIRDSKDIRSWRNALMYAEQILNPNRQPLYDLYHDIVLDAHLASLINKRINAVVNHPIKLVTLKGEVEHITEMVQTENFIYILQELLLAKFWGYTLLEMDFKSDENSIAASLIDRRHVKPEKNLVCRYPQEMEGIRYDKPPYDKYVLSAGRPNDLGLLLKAAPLVLYKRGVLAAWAIIPEGTDIEFVPNNSNGSAQLYDDLRKACNNELSVLVLGQTLTTDQGERGARSLGEVHYQVQEMMHSEDRIFILNLLNEKLLPLLEHHGYDTRGGQFVFDEIETLDTKTSLEIDMMLAQQVPIDDDYFYDKYNIPKPKQVTSLKPQIPNPKQQPLPGDAIAPSDSTANPPPSSPSSQSSKSLANSWGQPRGINRFLRFFV